MRGCSARTPAWLAASLVYLVTCSSVGTAGESTFVLSQTDEAAAVLPNKALCVDPQFSLYMTPERLLYTFNRRTNVSIVQQKATTSCHQRKSDYETSS